MNFFLLRNWRNSFISALTGLMYSLSLSAGTIETFLDRSLEELTTQERSELVEWLEQIPPQELLSILEKHSPNPYKHFQEQSTDHKLISQMNYLQSLAEPPLQLQSSDVGQSVISAIAKAIWGDWQTVPIPDAYCSNGSQYKIFISRSRGLFNRLAGNHKRLLVYLEPGGACWDYESCSGQAGIRGAANPNGIPDNYLNFGAFINDDRKGGSPMAAISPLILNNNPSGYYAKTSRWNKVFLPYCTGDVHMGNKKTTYLDPKGEKDPITYMHHGAINVQKAIEYMQKHFYQPKQLMVTGCSAGGTGALGNYHFFRKHLQN